MPNSPIDPLTWFMSLAFVVAVTMVKQGYEDWRRHKSDEYACIWNWISLVKGYLSAGNLLQGSAKRCFLGSVSSLPGSAWL